VIGFLGTDYMKIRDDFKVITDPYSGEDYVVVPPIVPDVAVIHALKGDRHGSLTVLGARNDRLLATAARKTIAVVEELVESDRVLPGLHEVYVAPIHVDAVVLAPGGAHPTECPGRYGIDAAHIMTYMAAAGDEASFQSYLETYIVGPPDHAAYLEKVGFRIP
jgi:glutaconate CoA-transferase subunit A